MDRNDNVLRIPGRLVALSWVSMAITALGASLPHGEGPPDSKSHQSLITVTGHGQVQARPDQAALRLGVESQADTATEAQGAVNDSMQRVLKKTREMGIPEKDIQTAGLTLVPIYAAQKPGEESLPSRIISYRSLSRLEIKIHDLKLAGPVIDAALKNGANRLEGVTFELNDETQARSDALKEAARDAQLHAGALADALNLHLERISKVTQDNLGFSPRPLLTVKSAAFAETPVEPGEINIGASITVEFVVAPQDAISNK